jgi:V/A-type H+-transporting ATPase subunit I
MAVGLASYYIASAFNGLALQLTEASIWALPGTILVLVFAHALNIGLCLVAIFAHGVRLNMLEFSTNAGVQWVGRPFTPFAVAVSQDKGDS